MVDHGSQENFKEIAFPDLLQGTPEAAKRQTRKKEMILEESKVKKLESIGDPRPVKETTIRGRAVDPPSSTNKVRRRRTKDHSTNARSKNSRTDHTDKSSKGRSHSSESTPSDRHVIRESEEKHKGSGEAKPRNIYDEEVSESRREKLVKSKNYSAKRDFIEEMNHLCAEDTGIIDVVEDYHENEWPCNTSAEGVLSDHNNIHHCIPIETNAEPYEVVDVVVKPKKTPSDNTSSTAHSADDDHVEIITELLIHQGEHLPGEESDSSLSSMHGQDGDEGDEEDEISSTSSASNSSEDAAALLERAHDRIARQHLQEEVEALTAVIERKDLELENIRGQLRRAIETKCDLVLAHNELEKSHEYSIQRKDINLLRMKKANMILLESNANAEKELLNEIVKLNDQMKEIEEKHREELDDWERLHRNEMLEKDFQIAQLKEELRQYKMAAGNLEQDFEEGESSKPTRIVKKEKNTRKSKSNYFINQ